MRYNELAKDKNKRSHSRSLSTFSKSERKELNMTATKKNEQNTNEVKNAKRVTLAQYREKLLADAVKRAIAKSTLALETAETARNKENSANVTSDNAIILVNANASASARVVEVYLHAKKHDVLFSKRVFERLTTDNENDTTAVKNARALLKSYTTTVYKSKFKVVLVDDEKTTANKKLEQLFDALHALHATA